VGCEPETRSEKGARCPIATPDLSPLRGRLLGLDVGDARIGVAVCDALGIVVTPLRAIRRKPEAAALQQIVALVASEVAEGIVVGLPLSLSGAFSDQTRSVAAFVERLHAAVSVPVTTWDERYTTVEAERILREQGVRREQRRDRIDAVAAAVILQDYLDAHLRRRE
jgi:putative Holliday junction resolvase